MLAQDLLNIILIKLFLILSDIYIFDILLDIF